jgi:hypothetical protein
MTETDVIFVLFSFGVFVNARRRHDVQRRQGRPEAH